MIAVALSGETLDEICWRTLGRTRAVTEQVLDLNPHLAALGPRLPEGTEVILPDLSAIAPDVRETVQLWN